MEKAPTGANALKESLVVDQGLLRTLTSSCKSRQPGAKRASTGTRVGVVPGKATPPERYSNRVRLRVHSDGGGGGRRLA